MRGGMFNFAKTNPKYIHEPRCHGRVGQVANGLPSNELKHPDGEVAEWPKATVC